MRRHLLPTRIGTILFWKIVKGMWRWRRRNIAVGSIRWWTGMEVHQWLRDRVPVRDRNPLVRMCPEEWKAGVQTETCARVSIAAHYSRWPKGGNDPDVHQWMNKINKMWSLHTMKYLLPNHKKVWSPDVHTAVWLNLENIMFIERSRTQKVTSCMIACIRNIQNRWILRCRRQTHGHQGLGAGVGEGRREWESTA